MSDPTGERSNRGGRRSVPKGSISKHVVSHDLSHENRVFFIKKLLGDKLEQDGAKNLGPGGATKFVELLDELLRTDSLAGRERSTCVRYLARVCGWHSILPDSAKISDYRTTSAYSYSGGSSSTVWAGIRGNQKIAVKVATFYMSYGEDRKKELTRGFCKEVVIWKYLDHPNILPFIGAMMVTEPGKEKYEIISELMEDGEIGKFIKRNPDANRLELLKDVATGLKYLHSQSVVHGDLKGQNILINKRRRACLVDFGVSRVLAEYASSWPPEPGGTILYMSPELLRPDVESKDIKATKESDIYALGIVIYEVICGVPPYLDLDPRIAAEKFADGEFPPRPSVGFTDFLWETMEACWQHEPGMRPSVDDVLKELNAALRA